MNYTYSDYLKFLENLSQALSELSALQNEKANAVKLHRLEELNEAIKKEQAISLQLRGLEKRRNEILGALGIKATLREMPGICEEKYKEQTQKAVNDILNKNDMLQLSRKSAADIIEKNSKLIQKALKQRGVEDLPDILPRTQGSISKKTDYSG